MRRRNEYGCLGMLVDIIFTLLFDDYDANRSLRNQARNSRSRTFLGNNRDIVEDDIRNDNLREALVQKMEEDKSLKERSEQLLKEKELSERDPKNYVYKTDENSKMDSI